LLKVATGSPSLLQSLHSYTLAVFRPGSTRRRSGGRLQAWHHGLSCSTSRSTRVWKTVSTCPLRRGNSNARPPISHSGQKCQAALLIVGGLMRMGFLRKSSRERTRTVERGHVSGRGPVWQPLNGHKSEGLQTLSKEGQ